MSRQKDLEQGTVDCAKTLLSKGLVVIPHDVLDDCEVEQFLRGTADLVFVTSQASMRVVVDEDDSKFLVTGYETGVGPFEFEVAQRLLQIWQETRRQLGKPPYLSPDETMSE
jgi:hypothetical protein